MSRRLFFFFQAEDGIRDVAVTGVQTCALPISTAIGAFTLGYILGLLALFAPGGVGVRELVLVGLLAPFLGSGGAGAVSVASRVLPTLTEAAAPLLTLPLRHRPQGSIPGDSLRPRSPSGR